MKKSIFGLVVLLLTATTVSAQSEKSNNTKAWKIGSVGINYGTVHDKYQDMSLDMMYDFTKNTALLNRNFPFSTNAIS